MASTSTIAPITITVGGDSGQWNIRLPQQSNGASPFEHVPTILAIGPNTLTPPATSQFLLIVPPVGSVITKILKGAAGDVGVSLSPGASILLPIPAGSSVLILDASGIETVEIYWL